MSNIKVVSVNEEDKQVEPEAPIEEAPEIVEELKTEEVPEEPTNKVIKETKPEAPPKRQTQKDKIQCAKCLKTMTIKSYKYSHEKNCQGQLSERPVKPQTKPKAKPKPKAEPIKEEEPPRELPPWKNKQPTMNEVLENSTRPIAINPINSLANHYQLLQNEYIKQKQEKYNSLCKGMFSAKPKKR